MTPVKTKPKIMIVDDSMTMRSLLNDALKQVKEVEVIALASSGRLALPRIRFYKPDLVLLDQEMPGMTGIEVLKNLDIDLQQTKVVMFSAHTTEGAKITLQALELGAFDFIAKPSGKSGTSFDEFLTNELIPKLKGWCGVNEQPTATTKLASRPRPKRLASGKFDLFLIGISTGGPVALREVIPRLPATLPAAILVVQHMPKEFTTLLAESLERTSEMSVKEATADEEVLPGTVYIAPGDRHMEILVKNGKRYIYLNDSEPILNCKPSVDVLFKSAANQNIPCSALIMTGMGYDGYLGMQELANGKNHLIAQSKKTCVVYGMPSGPVKDDLVDDVLDLNHIPGKIRELAG